MSSPLMLRAIVALLIISVQAACGEAALRPRLVLHEEPVGDDFWFAAPYVLVVRIISADTAGPRESIYHGGPKTLQLVKFLANVENTIKGNLPDKTITFFFFTKIDQNPNYYLDPGKRYVVSLRSEGDVLRSWADATQLKIEIRSGAHSQQDLPLNLGPSTTIAYLLLTPGTDYDPDVFRRSLAWPPYSHASPEYVQERLMLLQRHSNRLISDSACVASASMFWYHPKCLEGASNSPDGTIRQAATELFRDNFNLLERLKANPFFLSSDSWTNYSFQMLEIFSQDARPDVRKEACLFLRDFAPARAVPTCAP
jgi:hypothetical protein